LTTPRYRIALIPGDGIGQEVLPPACAVLDTVEAAVDVVDSFTNVLAHTTARTRDLGGTATTEEFTVLVLEGISRR
jgi:isocitrate/isopropylmalate dehydrogenase